MTMMRSSIFVMAVGFGLLGSTTVAAAELPAACRVKIDAGVPGWRLITPSPEVTRWAKEMKEGPDVLLVDLDADNVRDAAALIVTGSGDAATYRIAVCMQRKAGPELHIIEDPYCHDGIMITAKGTRAHNFETDEDVTYRTNGIHVYCFERAGATYLYRGGRFIRIVDSD